MGDGVHRASYPKPRYRSHLGSGVVARRLWTVFSGETVTTEGVIIARSGLDWLVEFRVMLGGVSSAETDTATMTEY